jgi:hypothetical protein
MGTVFFKIAQCSSLCRWSLSFVMVLSIMCHPQSLSGREKGYPEYSPERIQGFIRHLIGKKEYYRAHVELKRLQVVHPSFITEERFLVSELYLFYNGEQYGSVLNYAYSGDDTRSAIMSRIFKFDVYLSRTDYGSTASLNLQDFIGSAKTLDEYLVKRVIIAEILRERIPSFEYLVKRLGPKAPGINLEPYRDVVTYSSETIASLKNPNHALLFGIIPGMGYVYADRKPTGILALIAITILSTVTYFAFSSGNEHIGIFIGAAATFFYTGSIVGGYLETGKRNRSMMKRLGEHLADELDLEKDRDEIFRRYGLAD